MHKLEAEESLIFGQKKTVIATVVALCHSSHHGEK